MSEFNRRRPFDDDSLAAAFLLLERPAWHREAACRGSDPAVFYPERSETTVDAKRICEDCPVSQDCAEAGLYELYGVWGGTTGRARRGLRKQRRVA